MPFLEKIKEKSMTKNISKTVRMSQDTFDKLTIAAKHKSMPIFTFIEHALSEQSDRVLIGKNTDINTAILHDIWERISYVQAERKITLVGLAADTPEQQDKECKRFVEQVKEKVYNL